VANQTRQMRARQTTSGFTGRFEGTDFRYTNRPADRRTVEAGTVVTVVRGVERFGNGMVVEVNGEMVRVDQRVFEEVA